MDNQYIYFSDDHSAPYCDMVVTEGKYLFLSGLMSQNMDTGEILYGDIIFETKKLLDNLAVILEKYGSDMEHVVRTEVLLRNFSERDAMNVEYLKHFKPGFVPARLCYGNVGLAGQCKVEIMVTAVVK